MDIVKKNLLSIVCGVVALIAIVALFYPLGGKIGGLQSELDSRKGVYSALDGLRNKARTLPVIDPDKPTPEPLGRFPNDEIIKQGEAIPAAFQKEATDIATLARTMNQHKELVQGSLPTPMSSTYALNFRDSYREMIDHGLRQMLKAGYPPTQDDINLALKKLWDAKYAPMLIMINGQPRNQQQVQQLFQQESVEVPTNERKRVAAESMCYVDPPVQSNYAPWTVSAAPSLSPSQNNPGASQPSPIEIWYAQVQLWIQEDVVRAILRTNAGFKNVAEAPVKHLVKIDIPTQNLYVLPATYQPGTEIAGDPKTAVPKETTFNPTGRVCNPLYDVVRFELTANVEADRLEWFLKELGNKRFVTVTKMDVRPVDLGVQRALGYIYGDKLVVQVKLQCEQLFLHDWSRPLMPTEVAKNMGSTQGGGMMPPGMGAPEDLGGGMRY